MTTTYTDTYNRADIIRVYASFSADYRIVAEWTGLNSREYIDQTIAQIRVLAVEQYLSVVHLQLKSSNGTIRNAAAYRVSTSTAGWSSDRPGDLYWSSQPGDSLNIVVFYSQRWRNLSEAQREAFRAQYLPNWDASDFDGNYTGLVGQVDRRYASRGYGIERTRYSR